MTSVDTGTTTIGPRREIGAVGTAARMVAGLLLLADVLVGELTGSGFAPVAWSLGVVGFPALALAWQWWRARRHSERLTSTGPAGYAFSVVVGFVLIVLPYLVDVPSAPWDGGLIFVAVSLLVAAGRGYGGCEVLAVSNWLLRRDDQIGCFVFSPIDRLDRAS